MSALVTSQIFRLFVNTLTPDDKYSVAICRLSDHKFKRFFLKKKETFFRFFIVFLKYAWNLEHSEKKEECPSVIITEIFASERDVYLSV